MVGRHTHQVVLRRGAEELDLTAAEAPAEHAAIVILRGKECVSRVPVLSNMKPLLRTA